MGALFRANNDGTYDLIIDGRSAAYDLTEDEFAAALRSRRYDGPPPEVEDLTGYRTRLER